MKMHKLHFVWLGYHYAYMLRGQSSLYRAKMRGKR